MNKQEKKPLLVDIASLQSHMDRGLAAIRALGDAFKPKKDPKKSKHRGSKNHNQKRNKKRALMASKSRRINRLHEKRKKN